MSLDAQLSDDQRTATRQEYVLRLYVAGSTLRSREAIRNIRQFCEKHLAGRCDLQVIDIYQQPELAADAQIIAAPTLIKLVPGPMRRAIGDMSNEARVLRALDLTGVELLVAAPA